jgi:hypothetical protein
VPMDITQDRSILLTIKKAAEGRPSQPRMQVAAGLQCQSRAVPRQTNQDRSTGARSPTSDDGGRVTGRRGRRSCCRCDSGAHRPCRGCRRAEAKTGSWLASRCPVAAAPYFRPSRCGSACSSSPSRPCRCGEARRTPVGVWGGSRLPGETPGGGFSLGGREGRPSRPNHTLAGSAVIFSRFSVTRCSGCTSLTVLS